MNVLEVGVARSDAVSPLAQQLPPLLHLTLALARRRRLLGRDALPPQTRLAYELHEGDGPVAQHGHELQHQHGQKEHHVNEADRLVAGGLLERDGKRQIGLDEPCLFLFGLVYSLF